MQIWTLLDAVVYRPLFCPNKQNALPYVDAGVGAIAAAGSAVGDGADFLPEPRNSGSSGDPDLNDMVTNATANSGSDAVTDVLGNSTSNKTKRARMPKKPEVFNPGPDPPAARSAADAAPTSSGSVQKSKGKSAAAAGIGAGVVAVAAAAEEVVGAEAGRPGEVLYEVATAPFDHVAFLRDMKLVRL